MEKVLKRESGFSLKNKIITVTIMAAFFVLSAYVYIDLYSDTKDIVKNQAVKNVANISQLNGDSITRSINNRQILLETLASRIKNKNIRNVDEILTEIGTYVEAYDFYNIGILDENNMLHLPDNVVLDVSDHQFREDIWSGDFFISKSYMPSDGGKQALNLFSCPVYYDDGLKYVLIAPYYSVNLTQRMNISSLDGKGYTFLVNSKGEIVIYPQYYQDEDYNALMKYINDMSDIIPNESSDRYFTYNGEEYFAYFEEMGINDWYLMTCAKEKDVFAEASIITHNILIGTGLLWLMLLAAMIATAYSIYHSNKKLLYMTYYDELLDIGNTNALSVYFNQLPEESDSEIYLVIFDIDKFKEFNYIYGDEEGDRLLKYVVDTFREELPEVSIFRYFSDYFVTLDYCDSKSDYEKKVHRLLDRFKRDVEAGKTLPFEISIGVRKIEPGEPLRNIISDALIARETVKGDHIRHYAFYDEDIRFRRVSYMEMESDFTRALREKEFHIYYQPKYDIRTGEIIGAEALTRWIKPDNTIVSPGSFIPCFENSHQIILLDEYVLTEVCRQMKEMQSQGLDVKPVSVNLSRVHLRNPDILPKIENIIKNSGIDPSKLAFEITESALLEASIPMKIIMDYLHKLGCRIDMDDYGVGASNIDALISNNFDVIKLDKSFVDRIGNERAEEIIRSTAHMASKWGMEVLAEGVEEKYQAERLLELGCSYAQGFYYSKPVPEADYRKLLKSNENTRQNGMSFPTGINYFSEDMCDLLDASTLPTYIIDPENFVVMYCNRAMRKYLGEDPTGGFCYQRMRRLDSPCENCSAMRLYLNGDGSPKEVKSYLGVWVLIQTSPLRWRGHDYIQITGVDISKQKQIEEELSQRNREYEELLWNNNIL